MRYWISICIVSVIFVLLIGFAVLIPNEKNSDNDTKRVLQEAIIIDIPGTDIVNAANYTIAIAQIDGEIHNVNIEGLEVGNITSKQELIGRTILVYENSNDVFPYTAKKLKQ
ncbi:hypothetical protein bcgnr5372_37560 [Bacillus luti]|nr:hypothetical protein [Bacillus cereus]HDR8330632.1 hypothetical protein [Bacillus cereus]HDR8337242.1 hypothetical protein [Bacillus cereus]